MAYILDEVQVNNGQLIVAEDGVDVKSSGVKKTKQCTYIQGNTQIGKPDAFYSAAATLMVGREDTKGTPNAIETRGNVDIIGDGGTTNALYVSGGSGANTVHVIGDMYVSGAIDSGNKGRLASRFASADSKPKPFDIKHPSKEGWRLRYACIEGPEVGVYDRGRVRNEKIIKLPDYWKDLVDVESISVQLQPIGSHQDIIVKRWDDQFIYLQAQGGMPVNCFYHVYAARKDVNPLYVEYEGESWKDYPDPNFNPDTAPDIPNYNDPEYRTKRNTITI